MDDRDIQRLAHIQTHCRDILFFTAICNNSYARFSVNPSALAAVRVSLYHIGELAETVDPSDMPEYWKTVCAWSSLRTKDAQTMDTQKVWDWTQNVIPKLLRFCEDVKPN